MIPSSGRRADLRTDSPFFRIMAVAALALMLAFAGGCRIEIEEDEADLRSSVEAMLDESAAAWNRGELDVFMDDYLDSDATTYIGASGVLRGFDAIRGRYASSFEPGAERDSLRFENVRARRLGAIDGLITARWVLHQEGTVTGSGPVTLVVRHTSAGWKIIHDHSSADSRPAADE